MPFDSPTKEPREKSDTARRAGQVVAALRDPSLRPAGFEWNYAFCTTCVIGLTGLMFGEGNGCKPSMAADLLGLNPLQADRVFARVSPTQRHPYVTAEHAADALEACILENENT